ncbi:hypothetical protein GCWU000342_00150 [Shuttleworthella satelles DSM 14600]|uniref:Uncharacterized protein n=1 Tax=Shuttleworthella satelles DSM 14600 TaxID=626523 RepID=C4G865_9FIRM|nr:hypothetical protein GCWU000342_00150 [Shuttleworthia satelles DSM 14600]
MCSVKTNVISCHFPLNRRPLHISFTVYKATAKEVEENLVGMTIVDGVEIKSYATHFIDRVIG